MARGVSIHIGLDDLSSHYVVEGQRLFEPLDGCVKDAILMQRIAKDQGFETELFITEPNPAVPDAHTSQAELKAEFIFDRIGFHATQLKKDDIFLVTFSGHGGQTTNFNDDPEPEGFDQTWCLHNRMVIDDELAQLWSLFAPEVKIVLISDSCHSETVFESVMMENKTLPLNEVLTERRISETVRKNRRLKNGGSEILFKARFEADYEPVLVKLSADLEDQGINSFSEKITASLIVISACQDGENAQDGTNNGVFTSALKNIWFGTDSPNNGQKGSFGGTYSEFFDLVSPLTHSLNNNQTPEFFPQPMDDELENFPLINKIHLKDFINSTMFKI